MEQLTPTLRAILAQYEARLAPEEMRSFRAHLDAIAANFRKALVASAPGAERARTLHALMEESTADLGGAQPTCGRGCSACCHLEVELTLDEAALLATHIEAGHPIDEARLAEQASRPRHSERWRAPGAPANRCVFLGADGACTVYADRPAACRKLLVVSPPSECAKVNGKIEPITMPLVEVLLSTALSLEGAAFMSISKGVSRVLAREPT